jgi:AraC-like DNA-binding protein
MTRMSVTPTARVRVNNGKAFWLQEADAYIAECQRRQTCVRASELANRLHRTPTQLTREFHAAVGARLKDYLSCKQIERAKELLRSTHRTTAQIAVDSGYGNVRSFYRAFRRCTGLSPTEYREKIVTGAA